MWVGGEGEGRGGEGGEGWRGEGKRGRRGGDACLLINQYLNTHKVFPYLQTSDCSRDLRIHCASHTPKHYEQDTSADSDNIK